VAVYGRNVGQSITGGFVYRGNLVPALKGRYIFGDFVMGKIFAINMEGAKASYGDLFSTNFSISSFGLGFCFAET